MNKTTHFLVSLKHKEHLYIHGLNIEGYQNDPKTEIMMDRLMGMIKDGFQPIMEVDAEKAVLIKLTIKPETQAKLDEVCGRFKCTPSAVIRGILEIKPVYKPKYKPKRCKPKFTGEGYDSILKKIRAKQQAILQELPDIFYHSDVKEILYETGFSPGSATNIISRMLDENKIKVKEYNNRRRIYEKV